MSIDDSISNIETVDFGNPDGFCVRKRILFHLPTATEYDITFRRAIPEVFFDRRKQRGYTTEGFMREFGLEMKKYQTCEFQILRYE